MNSLEYPSSLPGETKCLAGDLWNMKWHWMQRQCSLLAPACHAGGRGFESRPLFMQNFEMAPINKWAPHIPT